MTKFQDKWPIGARVVQSAHSVEADRFPSERKAGKVVFGKVVGYSNDENCIRVLVDGKKTPTTWHCLFWWRVA